MEIICLVVVVLIAISCCLGSSDNDNYNDFGRDDWPKPYRDFTPPYGNTPETRGH